MIAIVYPQFYGVGGIARYLDSFLANLPEGHPPVILITGDEDRRPVQYTGVEIIHLPLPAGRFGLLRWSLAARAMILGLHQKQRIRLVNLHCPPLIPGLFLPRSVPMVLTAHTTYLGMSGMFYPEAYFESPWGRLSVAIKRWMEMRIFRQADAVVTLTEQGRQEVAAYGYKGPLVELPNGVDLSRFSVVQAGSREFDVLFAGRIEIRKGSRPMVDFCKTLIAQRPQVRICIVGYGDDDAYVREALEPFPENVVLAGKVPFSEVVQFYSQSRVYVSTAYYEGLPGTCLEAMAMQLPAVVWDFLFYRGLVLDGETGYVVKPNDISGMVSRVLGLLDDGERASAMGQAGRDVLAGRYDWKNIAARLTAFFVERAEQAS